MFAVRYFFLVAVELLLGRSNENMPGSSRAPSLRLTDMEAVRDTIGHVITRDVDPPTFATLGVPCLKFETNADSDYACHSQMYIRLHAGFANRQST